MPTASGYRIPADPDKAVANPHPLKFSVTYWTFGIGGAAYDTWVAPERFHTYREAAAWVLVHTTSVEVVKVEIEREDVV